MKNIKYLLFVFLIIFLINFKADLIKAVDFSIYYNGCCDVSGSGESYYDATRTKITGQHVTSESDKIYTCNDANFGGWKAVVYEGCEDSICDGIEGLDLGSFSSGGSVYPFVRYNGKVILNAIDKNGNKMSIDNCNGSNKTNTNSNTNTNNNSNNSNNNGGNTGNNTSYNNVNVEIKDKSCAKYHDSGSCKENNCYWNSDFKFCSPNGLVYLKCGDAYDIPEMVPKLTSIAVTLLKTVVPIILIIISIIQLVKSITAGKEDEMKKAQNSLIKKIIAAALVFFVVSIVQFVMMKVAADDAEKKNLSSCLSCFLNGTSKCSSLYYKDGYGFCYNVKTGKNELCN